MMGDTNASMGEGLGLEMMYPVGSIYMNLSNNANPRTIFGFGTWQALDEGRVLLGANATYSAGSKGGESAHTLTTQEMPSHGHGVSVNDTNTDHTHSGTTGDMSANSSHGHRLLVYSGGSAGISKVYGYSLTASNKGLDDDRSYETNATYDGGGRSEQYIENSSTQHTHGFTSGGMSANASHSHSVNQSNAGGGAAHDIMQPYLSVYMWVRVE